MVLRVGDAVIHLIGLEILCAALRVAILPVNLFLQRHPREGIVHKSVVDDALALGSVVAGDLAVCLQRFNLLQKSAAGLIGESG